MEPDIVGKWPERKMGLVHCVSNWQFLKPGSGLVWQHSSHICLTGHTRMFFCFWFFHSFLVESWSVFYPLIFSSFIDSLRTALFLIVDHAQQMVFETASHYCYLFVRTLLFQWSNIDFKLIISWRSFTVRWIIDLHDISYWNSSI